MSKQILDEIELMKTELENNLSQTQNGDIVDISRFPERLKNLHDAVQSLDQQYQASLTPGLQNLLNLLDQLSKEIQQQYEGLSKQIQMLEG